LHTVLLNMRVFVGDADAAGMSKTGKDEDIVGTRLIYPPEAGLNVAKAVNAFVQSKATGAALQER
jgi:hypothetical protein